MYGLSKIRKDGIPMRPVISSIGSYSYRLTKVLAARLEPVRHSQYILRDIFDFIDSLKGLNRKMMKYYMFAFNVNSLYTKVPLTYTINAILDKLYGSNHRCSKKKEKTK